MLNVNKVIVEMYLERLKGIRSIDVWLEERLVKDIIAKMHPDVRVELMKNAGVYDNGSIKERIRVCTKYIREQIIDNNLRTHTKNIILMSSKYTDESSNDNIDIVSCPRDIIKVILTDKINSVTLKKTTNTIYLNNTNENILKVVLDEEDFENTRIVLDLLSVTYKTL